MVSVVPEMVDCSRLAIVAGSDIIYYSNILVIVTVYLSPALPQLQIALPATSQHCCGVARVPLYSDTDARVGIECS